MKYKIIVFFGENNMYMDSVTIYDEDIYERIEGIVGKELEEFEYFQNLFTAIQYNMDKVKDWKVWSYLSKIIEKYTIYDDTKIGVSKVDLS